MVLKKKVLREDVFKAIKSFADEHHMTYEDALDLFYDVLNETVGGMEKLTYDKTEWEDEIKDTENNVLKEGTTFDAEKMNKIENAIEKLVDRVNKLTEIVESK